MGDQCLIIGITGTQSPETLRDILKMLGGKGLEVRHASSRYEGLTTFQIGTAHDLQKELAQAGITIELATAADARTGGTGEVAGSGVTLERLDLKLTTVLQLLAEKKEGGGAKGAKTQGEKRGGRAEKVLPEPPKNAPLDAAGNPAVLGDKPAGTLPFPGSTGAADGDNQEQQSTTTAEDADDDDTTTTTETTANEEDAEG